MFFWTKTDTVSNNIVHSVKSKCVVILRAPLVSHRTQKFQIHCTSLQGSAGNFSFALPWPWLNTSGQLPVEPLSNHYYVNICKIQTAGPAGLRAQEVFFKSTAKGGEIWVAKCSCTNKCGVGAARMVQRVLLFLIPHHFLQFYLSQARDALMKIATPASLISPLQLLRWHFALYPNPQRPSELPLLLEHFKCTSSNLV